MADEATTASPSAGGDHPTMCPDLQEAISQGTPLKPTTTKEPISGQDIMRSERVVKEVETFPKENLKHVETQEKTVLPDQEVIETELKHQQFKNNIEHFNKEELKHAETVEKDIKPSAEDIDKEKKEKESEN